MQKNLRCNRMKKGKSWLRSSDYFGELPHHILFKWSSDCLALSFWPSKNVCRGSPTARATGLRVLAANAGLGALGTLPEQRIWSLREEKWRQTNEDGLPTFTEKKESLLAGVFSRKLLEDWEHTACWTAKIPPNSVLATEIQGREGTKIIQELESSWTERETEYLRGLPTLQLLDSLIRQC